MGKTNNQSQDICWNRGMYFALRTLMHFIAAAHYCYAIYYDFSYVKVPANLKMGNNFGGKFKYLTVLNAFIQAFYFTISFLNDFIGTNDISPKKMPLIRKIKDNLLATLAFPCALNVGVTFWTLMAIDRELVFPKIFDDFFPSWLNHVLHTNVVVFIILELCTTFRKYPTRKFGLTILLTFMLCYAVWLHVIKYYSGLWVYPVLEVLDLPQRILFFIGSFIFCVTLYFIGEFTNNKIWKNEMKQVKTNKKKK